MPNRIIAILQRGNIFSQKQQLKMFIISLLASIGLYQQVKAACDPLASPCPSPCISVQFNCVSLNCQSFTGKLGDSTTNPFSGNISFVDGTVDLLVSVTYTDPNFADATIKGIVTGENAESCLSLNLWRYTNKDYLERELSQFKINYTDDGSAKRNYQFTIPSKNFVSLLQLSDDGTNYNFKGYYSLEFSIGKSLQSVLYFDFGAAIKRTSTADINTNFGSLSASTTLTCGSSCEISATSKIQFCSDEACTTPSDTYSLYLNDQVWIKQSLTTVGTQGYYLTDAIIYYTGDKLFKPATILQKKINQTGYAMYLIKITIAWTPVSISVTSSLSSTAGTRLLQTNKGSTQASSNEIECVKDKDTQECIVCDQTCDVDNSETEPNDGCPTDCDFAQIISYLMILAMIFIQ